MLQGSSQVQEQKENAYLQGRWHEQKEYYQRRSQIYKLWHQIFLLVGTLGALLVPVLLSFSQIPKLLPVIISLFVSISLALDNTFHFGDNWRSFRQTLEALKRERVYFDMSIEPYTDIQTAFSVFVQKSEGIIGKEEEGYFELHKSADKVSSDNTAN